MKRFRDKEIEQVARSVEARYEGRFEPHGAQLAVRPEQIRHLTSVGRALSWPYSRQQEDLASLGQVRVGRGGTTQTTDVSSLEQNDVPQDVEHWLRTEADNYLQQLTS